jgi:hypothetical protein
MQIQTRTISDYVIEDLHIDATRSLKEAIKRFAITGNRDWEFGYSWYQFSAEGWCLFSLTYPEFAPLLHLKEDK